MQETEEINPTAPSKVSLVDILTPNTKSVTIAKLICALSKAQGEIQNAAKRADNETFSARYADLASVWNACREPLSKNGLAIVQSPGRDGGGVYVETMLAHESGEWMSGRLYIQPGYTDKTGQFFELRDPQAIGSAITYARRYALASMVGVAPEDDDGESASGAGMSARRDPDGARQAKREKAAKENRAKGPQQPEFDWRNVVNYIGKRNGPIYKKPLGELSEDNLKWLLQTVKAKKKLSSTDRRLLEGLEKWDEERRGTPQEAEQKAKPQPRSSGGKTDGNEGVNLEGLASNLDFHDIAVPVFMEAAKGEGWTQAATFEKITDAEAGWFMENMDKVAEVCERVKQEREALGVTEGTEAGK